MIWINLSLAAVVIISILSYDQYQAEKPTREKETYDCVSEQIQIARQNWNSHLPTETEDAEFVAQDELSKFIVEICLK